MSIKVRPDGPQPFPRTGRCGRARGPSPQERPAIKSIAAGLHL